MNKKRWFGVVLMMPGTLAVLYVLITISFAVATFISNGVSTLIIVAVVVAMFIYGIGLTCPDLPDDDVVGMIKEV